MERTEQVKWHDDDEFWETLGPAIFSGERMAQGITDVANLVELLELTGGERICDLCCGVGRHSLELARRGFAVTGVDRTERYLAQARARAEADGLDIEFVRQDMRDFCRPEDFDVVLNLLTSFGYFDSPDDDCRVVRNVHRSLKPGGRLAVDVMGKEVLARIFRPGYWWRTDDGFVLVEAKVADGWSTVGNEWHVFSRGAERTMRFSHRLYSAAELAGLLANVGFERTQVYGSLAGSPYDHRAERLVVVGWK